MSRRKAYRPRIADRELAERLASTGAVLVEGARGCGKTETGRRAAASEVLLDTDRSAREALAVDPRFVLAGATPRLLDEWQVAPEIWNHLRRAVDERPEPGQFILTGSAVPADHITRYSGAGRIGRLRLRPMSLAELGRSSGEVSLAALLDGESAPGVKAELPAPELAELVCAGGWPGQLDAPPRAAMRASRDYLDDTCRVDLGRVDGVRRDPKRVRRFLRSLGRHAATCASLTTIARDVGGPDETVALSTARGYLAALDRVMVVEDQPPWAPRLRSRSRLRAAPKRHFADPSLAAAALAAGPERLLSDFGRFGFLFESLVVRDLRVYAQATGGRVFHYRDNTGLEVDAIVDAGPGRWGAFEIELGASRADEAARNLLRLAERVDPGPVGEPAVLGVIVGSGYGCRRPDGVAVIPCAALGP